MASGSFDEEDELDDSFADGLTTNDPAAAVPIGEPVDDELWDEADFDEEFDEDFSDEPDEDLEKFEKELNTDPAAPAAECDEFDEEFE